ncbi:MAG: DNA polymerase III subunit gamma/tau [bacterium]|nr:DNA polymerase III subunit gamma/tau [bacterium]
MSYLVFARKLRPQRFADLIGQEAIYQTLINAIKTGRVAHAFLFTGPRGTGKTSCARILTKALNCQNPQDAEPCNQCEPCREISAGISADVMEIDAASNRGIEHIRELRESVKFSPSKGRYKTYIIDEVHMLTTESFNALLKTLEEPPSHVKFILATTDPHKIPITVVSRCQRFDFAFIPQSKMVSYLTQVAQDEGLAISQTGLGLISRASSGGMRDALTTLDMLVSFSGQQIDDEAVVSLLGLGGAREMDLLLDAIITRDLYAALDNLEAQVRRGRSLDKLLAELMTAVKDLSLVKELPPDKLAWREFLPDQLTHYRELAQQISSAALQQIFQILMETEAQMRRSSQSKMAFEMALVKLCALERLQGLSEILGLLESARDPLKKSITPAPERHRPEAPRPKTEPDQPELSAQRLDPSQAVGPTEVPPSQATPQAANPATLPGPVPPTPRPAASQHPADLSSPTPAPQAELAPPAPASVEPEAIPRVIQAPPGPENPEPAQAALNPVQPEAHQRQATPAPELVQVDQAPDTETAPPGPATGTPPKPAQPDPGKPAVPSVKDLPERSEAPVAQGSPEPLVPPSAERSNETEAPAAKPLPQPPAVAAPQTEPQRVAEQSRTSAPAWSAPEDPGEPPEWLDAEADTLPERPLDERPEPPEYVGGDLWELAEAYDPSPEEMGEGTAGPAEEPPAPAAAAPNEALEGSGTDPVAATEATGLRFEAPAAVQMEAQDPVPVTQDEGPVEQEIEAALPSNPTSALWNEVSTRSAASELQTTAPQDSEPDWRDFVTRFSGVGNQSLLSFLKSSVALEFSAEKLVIGCRNPALFSNEKRAQLAEFAAGYFGHEPKIEILASDRAAEESLWALELRGRAAAEVARKEAAFEDPQVLKIKEVFPQSQTKSWEPPNPKKE